MTIFDKVTDPSTAQWILVFFDFFTIIFFFGFHYGQFKDLRSDVKDVKRILEKHTEKMEKHAADISRVEGMVIR